MGRSGMGFRWRHLSAPSPPGLADRVPTSTAVFLNSHQVSGRLRRGTVFYDPYNSLQLGELFSPFGDKARKSKRAIWEVTQGEGVELRP